MATNTYTALQTQVLGSSAASVTFTGISQAYTDLVLICNPNNASSTNTKVQVGNGSLDTGTNYSATQLYGNGSSAASLRVTSTNYALGGVNGGYSNQTIHFMNYSNTTTYKTILSRGNASSAYIDAAVSTWRSTSAINTIMVQQDGGSYPAGSTFTLYAVQAA